MGTPARRPFAYASGQPGTRHVCRKEDVMTEIILNFPVRSRARLSCVWVETGNPARPLACKWISGSAAPARKAAGAAEPQPRPLCA